MLSGIDVSIPWGAEQKRRVVYETGHNVPRPELIKETLNWLDKFLGPAK
jgi:hypothetical protein